MLSSIHPLGERTRQQRWGLTAGAYNVSTTWLNGGDRATAAPYSDLRDQQRQADAEGASEVEDQERAAAVLTELVGETPDIPHADREAHRREHETPA